MSLIKYLGDDVTSFVILLPLLSYDTPSFSDMFKLSQLSKETAVSTSSLKETLEFSTIWPRCPPSFRDKLSRY